MHPRAALGGLYRAGCARCASPRSLAELHRARTIASSYLRKVAEGEQRWEERALKIQNGELRHVWDVLDERGYIKDVAGYVFWRRARVRARV